MPSNAFFPPRRVTKMKKVHFVSLMKVLELINTSSIRGYSNNAGRKRVYTKVSPNITWHGMVEGGGWSKCYVTFFKTLQIYLFAF